MDKIFKKRFENLEKKAPDHILENILNKVDGAASSAPKYSSIKIALWSAVAVVAIVTTFLLLPNKAEKSSITQVVEETIIENNELETAIASNAVRPEVSENSSNNTILTEDFIINTDNDSKIENNPNNEQNKIASTEQSELNENIEENVSQFTITAPRHTCSGECELKIDMNYSGEWKADKTVFIQSPNSSKTLVRCLEQEKVLFTYVYDGYMDTFTVFFQKPAELTYTVTPEACGEENGKVEFQFPNTREFSSTNTYQLSGKSFERLIMGNYTFELEDNFACRYLYKVELPTENIKGNIIYEALEMRVDYPIYFSAEIEADADYIWNFGDGQLSYEKKPNHKYQEPGKYNVELQIIKANCYETIVLENLEIKDRLLELPNIFTPNNDGKNDIFMVSIPENTKSFEAYILNKEGQLIYKWTDAAKGWDGLMMSGQEAQPGSYYYIIKGTDSTNKAFEYKSFLELKR